MEIISSSDGAPMSENEAKLGLSLGGNIDMSLKATASFFITFLVCYSRKYVIEGSVEEAHCVYDDHFSSC